LFALSSLQRLRRYTELDDTVANNRLLSLYLNLTSKNIEKYCSCLFQKTSRTEYFDVDSITTQFFPKAVPISSITSIASDSTGLYDGAESTLSDYYIGSDSRSINLDYPQIKAKRGLRIIYTGGISEHGTQSIFTLTNITGTFVADKFITGSNSGAVGIITTTTTASPITIDVLYGIFEVGDTLTMQNTEGGSDVSNVSAVVATVTQQSLSEAAPEIAMACETEVRYLFQHKDNFETTSISRDGSSYQKNDKPLQQYILQPQTRSILQSHRRYFI